MIDIPCFWWGKSSGIKRWYKSIHERITNKNIDDEELNRIIIMHLRQMITIYIVLGFVRQQLYKGINQFSSLKYYFT
jgi:hypothetical protein